MSTAFFPDARFAQLAVALLCYVGICLNAAGLTVWGVRREPAQALVTLLFLGLFPLPLRWSSPALALVQYALVVVAIAGVGANQVRFALMRHREVRAYTAGTSAAPVGLAATVLIAAPAVLLAAYTILLCRNAVEALRAQEPPRRLAVRCAPEGSAGVVEVRDNGPGIPADELPRLFEPFCTTKSSGTGLGLPIARRIVDAHGGRVAVESAPGARTVFRVELPLVR